MLNAFTNNGIHPQSLQMNLKEEIIASAPRETPLRGTWALKSKRDQTSDRNDCMFT